MTRKKSVRILFSCNFFSKCFWFVVGWSPGYRPFGYGGLTVYSLLTFQMSITLTWLKIQESNSQPFLLLKKKYHGCWLSIMKPSCSGFLTTSSSRGNGAINLGPSWGMEGRNCLGPRLTPGPHCGTKWNSSTQVAKKKQMFSTAKCKIWGKWLYGPLAEMLTFECYTQEIIR
jgi:hypothetical protein